MTKVVEWVLVFVLWMVMAFALSLISAIPVFFLWNWLMPLLFKLTAITFMQAWGLSLLCSLLFKSTNTTKGN